MRFRNLDTSWPSLSLTLAAVVRVSTSIRPISSRHSWTQTAHTNNNQLTRQTDGTFLKCFYFFYIMGDLRDCHLNTVKKQAWLLSHLSNHFIKIHRSRSIPDSWANNKLQLRTTKWHKSMNPYIFLWKK